MNDRSSVWEGCKPEEKSRRVGRIFRLADSGITGHKNGLACGSLCNKIGANKMRIRWIDRNIEA